MSSPPPGSPKHTVPPISKPSSPLREEVTGGLLSTEPLADTSDYTSDASEDDLRNRYATEQTTQRLEARKTSFQEKQKWSFWGNFAQSFLESLLIGLIFFLIAEVVWWTKMKRDNPSVTVWEVVKSLSFLTSQKLSKDSFEQAFVRSCAVIALIYAAWEMSDWLAMALPVVFKSLFSIGTRTTKSSKGKMVNKISRQFVYFQSIAPYTRVVIFFGLVLIWCAIFLYESKTINPQKAQQGIKQAASAWKDNLERLLSVAVIVSAFVAVEKWIIRVIAVGFHRNAFLERVRDLNFKFLVLKRLQAYSNGITSTSFTIAPPGYGRRESRDIAALTEFERAPMDANIERARSAARTISEMIWTSLVQAESEAGKPPADYITPETLLRIFPTRPDHQIADYTDIWPIFAPANASKLAKVDFISAVIEIYEQRHNVQRSMKANAKIVKKLDYILLTIALVMALTAASPFYKIDLTAFVTFFGFLSTSLSIVFRAQVQQIFNMMIFVFVQHSFDVGDRVVIANENYIVENIEIYTTTLKRWDGELVYMPNASLATKDIENIRRSSCQSDLIDINISAATKTEALTDLRHRMTEWVGKEKDDFTGYLDIAAYELTSKDVMKVKFIVQYQSNFQDQAKRNSRKAKFVLALKQAVVDSGISLS